MTNLSDDECYVDHSIPNIALNKQTYSSSVISPISLAVDGKQLYLGSSKCNIFKVSYMSFLGIQNHPLSIMTASTG